MNTKCTTLHKCAVCGKEFKPRGPKRTCSPECSLAHSRETKRVYNAKRRAAERAKKVCKLAKCVICGKEFKPHAIQKTCSPECSAIYAKNWNKKYYYTHEGAERSRRVRDPRKPIRCAYCGKEFQPREKNVKYCSPRCRMKTMLARKRAANVERLTLRCAVCGKEFVAQRTTKKYCSRKCASKAKREKNREWWRTYGRKRDWRAEAERKEKLRHSHGQSCGYSLMGVSRRIIEEIGDAVFGPLAAGAMENCEGV